MQEEKRKKPSATYLALRWLIWLFSPRMRVEGAENLPEEPCVIVGNHSQMYGPIACELYSPRKRYTWCAGEMMAWKEIHGYAYKDFWSFKPKAVRWWYKFLSYVITPLAVCLFNNAETIPVYHDTRILTTFRTTVRRLEEGADIVIFPEHNVKNNNILYELQDRFIDVARMYFKKTGQAIEFVPLYIAPRLKKMIYGKPVRFDPAAPIAEERRRICACLTEEITGIALAQPVHTVIPYRNIPKKYYPTNTPLSEITYEETTC